MFSSPSFVIKYAINFICNFVEASSTGGECCERERGCVRFGWATGCALSRPEAAHTCLVFVRPSHSMCLDNICVSRAKGVRFNQSYYSILHINKFKHFLVHMNRTTSDLLFIFVLSRIG